MLDYHIYVDLHEERNHKAIMELKINVKGLHKCPPKKCSFCKGRFDVLKSYNIRSCQNMVMHRKSKYPTWSEGTFKIVYFVGSNTDNFVKVYNLLSNTDNKNRECW